ncbi:T-cell surface glycoprotein CD4-like, partial [Heptranchias perlo]|uniref:T-cell surface glycoprotein CD4-like n=1 Tax=Heptranchias perlo TaxID=212740 RepID=UPI00355AB341
MAIIRRLSLKMLLVLTSLQHAFQDGAAALTLEDDVYALEGENVVLLCVMDYKGSRPIMKPNGDWTWKGGEGNPSIETLSKYGFGSAPTKGKSNLAQRSRVVTTTHKGNFSLVVHGVRASDSGCFKCHITYNHYVASASRQLHVVRVTFNGLRPALEREAVTLTCHASERIVTWSTPGAGKRSGATVEIKALTVEDHGRWTCRVQIGERTLETSYQLDVL